MKVELWAIAQVDGRLGCPLYPVPVFDWVSSQANSKSRTRGQMGFFQGRAAEGEAERGRKPAQGTLTDRLELRAAGAQACWAPGGDVQNTVSELSHAGGCPPVTSSRLHKPQQTFSGQQDTLGVDRNGESRGQLSHSQSPPSCLERRGVVRSSSSRIGPRGRQQWKPQANHGRANK